MNGGWSPESQSTIAVFVIGGLLVLAHVISVHVNAGGGVG